MPASSAIASRSSRTTTWCWPSRRAARRSTRWPRWKRRTRGGAFTAAIVNAMGSQAARVCDGAHLHAGRAGDRRRQHQGLHRLGHRPLPAGHLSGPGAGRAGSTPSARALIHALSTLPGLAGKLLEDALAQRPLSASWPSASTRYHNFLYLGRGINYPIAREGALKLKEISYIHAEGYPAGEMKHGPIALIDDSMPTVVVAPRDSVYDKMISQVEQVKARSGLVLAVAHAGRRLSCAPRPTTCCRSRPPTNCSRRSWP